MKTAVVLAGVALATAACGGHGGGAGKSSPATSTFRSTSTSTATTFTGPTMSGHYIKTETDPESGESSTEDWYVTPCGDGCADVRHADGPYGQARFLNGQWTLDISGDTVVCPDGTKVPDSENVHYTWDPKTLAGTARLTETIATCGASAPESSTDTLQLRQAP